jgi:hypothetical protein
MDSDVRRAPHARLDPKSAPNSESPKARTIVGEYLGDIQLIGTKAIPVLSIGCS